MGAKVLVASIVTGLVFIVVGTAGILLANKFVTSYVSSEIQLTPASEIYKGWLKPSLPVYVKFYLFNLRNGLEFEKTGAKPTFEEIGPFVYREVTIKEDIVNNQNVTISYNERKQYFFEPSLSRYDNDLVNVTTLNMAPISMFHAIRYKSSRLHDLVNKALELAGQTVLTKRTARELIFGYRDTFLSWLQFLDSSLVGCDTVSLYYVRNDTTVGPYTINTGVDDLTKIGQFESFNHSDMLNYWSSDFANQLTGTDGSVIQPFLDENSTLTFFKPDYCRSIKATYAETITTDYDIRLIGYALDKETFASEATNPENAGFCTPRGNCLPAGVLNLTSCYGKPVVLSNPHFLNADKKFINDINGLQMTPDEQKYNSIIYVEPLTGIPMRGNKRVQINTQLFKDPRIVVTRNLPEIMYPLFWLDQSFEADKETTHAFYKKVQLPINVLYYAKYTLLGVGTLMLVLSSVYIGLLVIKHRRLNQQMRNQASINRSETERSPLLPSFRN